MTQYDSVASTGQPHTTFATGSRRDNRKGKGRFDLLSPIVALRDAKHMENGAEKYEARNWEKGQPLSTFLDSAERHLNALKEGRRDEDHAAAIRWNIGCLIHVEEMVRRGKLPAELLDLPDYTEKVKESPEPVKPWEYSESTRWIHGESRYRVRDGEIEFESFDYQKRQWNGRWKTSNEYRFVAEIQSAEEKGVFARESD